jgi:DNA-binding MarR family transcriptional regulator
VRVVAALGDGGPCCPDIVRASGMHKSTVSRAVAALSEQGWIEYREDEADGRRAILDFTAKGRRGFAAIAAVAAASEREWLSRLGRSRRSVLAALEKLQQAIDSQA